MAITRLDYTISTETANGEVILCELTKEITGSFSGSAELQYMVRKQDTLQVYFTKSTGTLTVAEENEVDDIVAIHEATQSLCLPEEQLLTNGVLPMSGNLDMGAFNITNVTLVDGVDVSAHATRHEQGGADEVDGDHLDIDFTPAAYTPRIAGVPEANNLDQLAAHLAGIDDAISSASVAVPLGNDLTGSNLTNATVVGLYDHPFSSSVSQSVAVGDLLVFVSSSTEGFVWNNVSSASISGAFHAPTHILGGTDEIDGDQLAIDFTPSAYTPRIIGVPEATDLDHLAAHLAGIDDAIYTASLFEINADRTTSTGSVSTTDTNNWVEAFTHEHSVIASNAGLYRISWYYVWSSDTTTNDFKARIQVDNTEIIHFHRQEAKDAGGPGFGGTDQRIPTTGFAYVQLTASGVPHEIDIDIMASQNGREAAIHTASIECWRVE